MLDAILGFAGKALDSWSSSSNAKEANATNERIAAQNIANQREFAQQGIRWKVADAQAAGLHPLAALGAQTNSFSNVVGGDHVSPKTDFGGMGQDIGRAIDAGSTAAERQDRMGQAIARTAQVFSLEKMNLENEVLKNQVTLTRAQLPPPFPPSALAHLSRSPRRSDQGHPIDEKKIEQQASDAPALERYKLMGVPLLSDPSMTDGQAVADRLGESEPLEFMTAIANTLADIKFTAQQRAGMGKERNPFRHWRKRNSFSDRFHY